jgi:hypothetical protein
MYIGTLRVDLGTDVSDGVATYLVSLSKDNIVYLRHPDHGTSPLPAATCAIVGMAPDKSKLVLANEMMRATTDRLCPLLYESRMIYKLRPAANERSSLAGVMAICMSL